MVFNSLEFLIFFPIVVLIYFCVPQKTKNFWLLISSYYFYMSWNPKYAILILLSTTITWLGGLSFGHINKLDLPGQKKEFWKKICVLACLSSNLLILAFFKYYHFLVDNMALVLSHLRIEFHPPVVDVLLPVGISFYTFQALGYIIDVYRGTIEPERNFLQYALFISFFPQLVAGPIERSKNLFRQIHEAHYFDAERVCRGLLMMGWGFFKKLVIADRAAILVTAVYDSYMEYTGLQIVIATMIFAVQIYCDFSGYSDIAIGAAEVMGFKLMQNFNSPYFARSVSEFWRRWHISLSTWFRDYLYIPLGGNRGGKWKTYRNLLITFCVSGLWHGARWSYVVWGGVNGLYQVVGDMTKEFRSNIQRFFKINTQCWSYRFFQGILTFVLIDFSWLFFRANGFEAAVGMIQHIISSPGWFSMIDSQNVLGICTLSLDEKDFYLLLIAMFVLLVLDLYKDKINFRTALLKQNIVFRWIVYYCIILIIVIFGIYGPEYDASTFIYFQF